MKRKKSAGNNKFNLCPGKLLLVPTSEFIYFSARAEISAVNRAQLKLANRQTV
jgi:hypothetical protein